MGRDDEVLGVNVLAHFKRRYGEGPWHLVAHLIAFAIAAFALVQLLDERRWVNFLAWFIGAALLHDLVLLPIYSAIDRLAHSRVSRLHRSGTMVRRSTQPRQRSHHHPIRQRQRPNLQGLQQNTQNILQ